MRIRNQMQTYQDVLDFVKKNPVCTLATVDGDQPRVRGFFTLFFDDDRIYFTTGAPKEVYQAAGQESQGRALLPHAGFRHYAAHRRNSRIRR